MKTIGLLGGVSWESTVEYCRTIHRDVGKTLGRFHSAKILMHSVDFGAIEVPLIHIADAAGEAIARRELEKVGLLGTRYTVEGEFCKERLTGLFGLSVLIPPDETVTMINDVIFNELCHGVINHAPRDRFKEIIHQLAGRGAEGIILGCTEIPLLMQKGESPVAVFDATSLHALKAVHFALA